MRADDLVDLQTQRPHAFGKAHRQCLLRPDGLRCIGASEYIGLEENALLRQIGDQQFARMRIRTDVDQLDRATAIAEHPLAIFRQQKLRSARLIAKTVEVRRSSKCFDEPPIARRRNHRRSPSDQRTYAADVITVMMSDRDVTNRLARQQLLDACNQTFAAGAGTLDRKSTRLNSSHVE